MYLFFNFFQVHKKLGNAHLSLMHFSWATDLDPKGANSQIKDAIDPAISRNLSQADTLDDSTQTHAGGYLVVLIQVVQNVDSKILIFQSLVYEF